MVSTSKRPRAASDDEERASSRGQHAKRPRIENAQGSPSPTLSAGDGTAGDETANNDALVPDPADGVALTDSEESLSDLPDEEAITDSEEPVLDPADGVALTDNEELLSNLADEEWLLDLADEEAITDSEQPVPNPADRVAVTNSDKLVPVAVDRDAAHEDEIVYQNRMVPNLALRTGNEKYGEKDARRKQPTEAEERLRNAQDVMLKTLVDAFRSHNRETISSKKEEKGIDYSLPPMTNIDDMFADMVGRLWHKHGLQDAVKQLRKTVLKVATMCSGTEAPILSMNSIADG